ncbi:MULTISPECIES: DUF2267 domain-containing protein [Rhizobium]|uniref:Uncharacterized protein (DUF2267 family) n=1 Tax=Rhizobium paranaense TaxID=1650438 RepID=A0A7W8XUS5_9HYPH|nr:DUF2267 domain-containing protein [Rhizobium paranaense]MBB5575937.1 uncharacterized protein (DUF2267 family) [Rhizobium paranaense]
MTYIPSQTFPDAARQAEIWVAELAEQLHCERRQAYEILRLVLHAVRDCISLQESVDFANHLPMLLRGLFYENWHPTEAKPAQTRADLSAEVSRRLKHIEFDAKKVMEEFFTLLEHRLNSNGFAKLDRVLRGGVAVTCIEVLSESGIVGERRSEKPTDTDIGRIGTNPPPSRDTGT